MNALVKTAIAIGGIEIRTDTDGDESSQDDLLESYARSKGFNWEKVYYVEEWVSVQTFATRHDADRFIKRQGHNYKELRVYPR